MKTKPLSIKLIATGFFIAPFANLFQIAYFNHWPLTGPRSVFYHLNAFEWSILAGFFVAAFGVLSVKKWGYFTCLTFLSFLIINNVYALFLNEKAYGPYVIILFELITFGIVGFFLQQHVIAPYFNPKMRWWETRERIKINIQGQIRMGSVVSQCQLGDISAGGCFVHCDRELVLNDLLWINISLGENHVTTMAEVVWIKKTASLVSATASVPTSIAAEGAAVAAALPGSATAIAATAMAITAPDRGRPSTLLPVLPGPTYGYGLIFRSIQKSEKKILQRILSELRVAAKNSGGQNRQNRDNILSA